MQVFSTTLNQMLVLFLFIALGYFLNLKGILPLNTSLAISRLETNVLLPCLVFVTFYKYCTIEYLSLKWVYIAYGGALTVVFVIVGLVLSRIFAKENYLQKIYAYSFTVANISFMGNAVVLGTFGDEVLFDYMFFTLPLQLYIYSYGIASLKPQNAANKFSLKSFINPMFISMAIGILSGVLEIPVPSFLLTAVSSAGACMSPLAMILTGFIIGNYSLKKLASEKKVYIASVLRLIVLPLIYVLILKLLNTDSDIIKVVLCATAMPLGLNTVVFPAAYGGDTTAGASMALISHLMSVITIPIMFALIL